MPKACLVMKSTKYNLFRGACLLQKQDWHSRVNEIVENTWPWRHSLLLALERLLLDAIGLYCFVFLFMRGRNALFLQAQFLTL